MQAEDENCVWLMRWYASQSNGEWEHQHGVEIGTLDNPGWSLKVDLKETALEGRSFEPVSVDGDVLWMAAKIEDSRFVARGGPLSLDGLIGLFRAWATQADKGRT